MPRRIPYGHSKQMHPLHRKATVGPSGSNLGHFCCANHCTRLSVLIMNSTFYTICFYEPDPLPHAEGSQIRSDHNQELKCASFTTGILSHSVIRLFRQGKFYSHLDTPGYPISDVSHPHVSACSAPLAAPGCCICGSLKGCSHIMCLRRGYPS